MAIMSKKPSLQVWGENVEIEKSTSPTNSINLQSKSLFPENDWFTKKSLDILELYFFFSTVFFPVQILSFIGTQSAMAPRWPGQYFCQFEKRLPQPEIKSTRWIQLKIRFNPA